MNIAEINRDDTDHNLVYFRLQVSCVPTALISQLQEKLSCKIVNSEFLGNTRHSSVALDVIFILISFGYNIEGSNFTC